MANRINVSLSLRTTEFLRSLNQAERSLKRSAENMQRVGQNLSMSLTAPIGALGVSIVATAAKFEKSMNGVLAVTAGAGDSFKELEALARDLGATTQFSATEAANAIEMLGRNGLTAQQILDGAATSSLMLAAATGTDLATAANVATDAMSQFGLQAQDLAQVADLIAGSTSNSKFSIDDFQFALANAGGVAGVAGISFADFATSVAAISPAFASGQDAGTSLKTFFNSLVPSTKAATAEMERLGIITADGANRFLNADGSFRSMNEIVAVLNESFAGLSESQQISAAQTIFGTDAMRAALGMAKLTGAEFENLAERIGDVSATEQAEIRMRGFEGAMKRLQSAFETLQLSIASSGLLEFAQGLVEGLTSLLLRFSELPAPILATVTGIAGFLAVLGPAAFALSSFYNMQLLAIGALKNMALALGRLRIMQAAATASQFSLNAAMLANPLGVTVAAIAGLVAILAVVYKRNEAFRNSVNAIAKGLQVLASGALSIFKTSLQAIYIIMRSVIQVIVQTIRQLFALAVEITRTVAQFVLGEEGIKRFVAVLRTIRDAFVFAFKNVPALVAGVRSVLLQAAQNVANFFQLMGNEIQILVLKGRKAVTLFPDAKKEIQQQIDALRAQSENLKSAGMSLGEAFRVGFRSQAFLDSGAMGGGGLSANGAASGDAGAEGNNDLLIAPTLEAEKATKKLRKEKEKLVDIEGHYASKVKVTNEVQRSLSEGFEEVANKIVDVEGSMKKASDSLGEYREGIETLNVVENGWLQNSTQRWMNFQQQIKEASGAISDAFVSLKNSAIESLGTLASDLLDVNEKAKQMSEQMGISFEEARQKVIRSAIGNALKTGFLMPIISLAEQLGKIAISTGLAVSAIQKALLTLSGPVAIAAGAALLGVAAFAKARMKSMATPFADGGIVMPRPGGIFANIGEAGKAEAVIPLDRLPSLLGAGAGQQRSSPTLITRISGRDLEFILTDYLRDRARFA